MSKLMHWIIVFFSVILGVQFSSFFPLKLCIVNM